MIVNKNLLYFIIFIIVGAIIFGIYFSTTRSKETKKDDESKIQVSDSQKTKDDQAIIEAVNILVYIPTSVKPTIATISDKEQINGDQFLSKAEIGDKLLIYSTVGKGILYRPSINKIIDIIPVESNNKQIDISGHNTSSILQGSNSN